MKRIIVPLAFVVAATAAQAQGYAGAMLALTRISDGCPTGAECGNRPLGGKIFAGTVFSSALVDVGVGKVDGIEVALNKFGSRSSTSPTTLTRLRSGTTTLETVPSTEGETIEATAVSASGVAHIPLGAGFTFAPKLGVAYVTATVKSEKYGLSNGSVSERNIEPFAALGFEYLAPLNIKILAGLEATRFKAAGKSGTLSSFGIGAAKQF